MINELLKQLPHRYPFLLIDRILELDPGHSVQVLKNVSVNEPYFLGHFPEQPVYPGVLILESMAQSTALITRSCADFVEEDHQYHLFTGIDKARFKRLVIPGDQIVIHTSLVKTKQGVSQFESVSFVDDKVVCKAQLRGAVRRLTA